MNTAADWQRRDLQLQVGELVFVQTKPNHMNIMHAQRNPKLSTWYLGPFPHCDACGGSGISTCSSRGVCQSSSFLCIQSKRSRGITTPVHYLPPNLDDQLHATMPQAHILVLQQTAAGIEALTKWQGLPDKDAWWETAPKVCQCYSELPQENQVASLAEGDDGPV